MAVEGRIRKKSADERSNDRPLVASVEHALAQNPLHHSHSTDAPGPIRTADLSLRRYDA
jgi:hypothetical protein